MSQQYPAPQQSNQPYAAPQYSAPVEDPGKTLGIVGFILAFVFAIAGIVVSAIAKKQSREAGFDNQLAKWGFILSIVFTVLQVLYVVIVVIAAVAAVSSGGTTY